MEWVKCKKRKKKLIAQKHNKSSKFRYGLERRQKAKNLQPKIVKQEVSTRWNAALEMFESILNDPNSRGSKNKFAVSQEESLDQINKNIEAINETLDEVGAQQIIKKE